MENIKFIFSILAAIIGVVAFVPYVRDIYSGKTTPHIYTWLVWLITQSIAVAGAFKGGGGLVLNLFVGLFFVFLIFLLSLKKGTKNITRSDTVILVGALISVFVYLQLDQPLLAVLMVSLIDLLGYVPTFRKTYEEPWSETVGAWIAFAISNVFAIVALKEYNLLTFTYLATITLANVTVVLICVLRKKYLQR